MKIIRLITHFICVLLIIGFAGGYSNGNTDFLTSILLIIFTGILMIVNEIVYNIIEVYKNGKQNNRYSSKYNLRVKSDESRVRSNGRILQKFR